MKESKETVDCHEVYPKIIRIVLPIPPQKPGPVNCYLFLGKEMTLLDTGLPFTVDLLREGLQTEGVSFHDIKRIVLTHAHPDHFGGTLAIREVASENLEVISSCADADALKHGMLMHSDNYLKFMAVLGVPEAVRDSLWKARSNYRFMERKIEVDLCVNDGDMLVLGDYRGRVIATPGHTVGSICLYLEEEDILFSGDHLLPHITPNALVMPEQDEVLPTRCSQQEFHDSIQKIEEINPGTTYPGHGEMIRDVRRMGDVYRRCFSERQVRILEILHTGTQNIFEIAQKLFPEAEEDILGFEIPLMLSEVYSHLQILESQGRIVLRVQDDLLRVII